MDIKLRSNGPSADLRGEMELEHEFIETRPGKVSPPKKRPKLTDIIKGFMLIAMIAASAALILSGAVHMLQTPDYWETATLKERIRMNHYTSEELLRYARNLNRYLLYYDGKHFEEKTVDNGLVTEEDIAAKQDELYTLYEGEEAEIRLRYEQRIVESGYQYDGSVDYNEQVVETESGTSYNTYDHGILDASLIRQRNTEITALMEKYNYDEAELKEMIAEEKRQNYADITEYLESAPGLQYYIHDSRRNELYTNMPISSETQLSALINSSAYHEEFSLDDELFLGVTFNGHNLGYSFGEAGFTGSIFILHSGVTQPNNFTTRVHGLVDEMSQSRTYRGENFVLFGVSLIMLAFSVFMAAKNAAAVVRANALIFKVHSWLPLTLKALGAFAALALLADIQGVDLARYISNGWWMDALLFTTVCAALVLALGISLEYVIATLRNFRRLKNEPEVLMAKWVFRSFWFIFKSRSPFVIATYVTMVLLAFFGAFVAFMFGEPFALFLTTAMAVIAHFFIVDHARLMFYIHEMTAGRLDGVAAERGLLSGSVKGLSRVGAGITAAVDDRIKSERMKTELITNVSHDLKTPLTSIISYIALLKELPNQSVTAMGYIDVLDKKSERLKVLIEDLFEASKLNTGNVELALERADVVNLINQTLGELSEKIAASGLVFRFTHRPEHIYMNCDGNKMYRVFENLIGNIMKYALPGSRAYIDVQEEPAGVIRIVFRNMSAYELNIPADELFDRFKRGDAARTTEGSGLGLTIARNVVEMHGGKMMIDIDGDLFKVTILFEG